MILKKQPAVDTSHSISRPPKKVVLLGDINIDVSMQIDRYPSPGHEGLSDKVETQVGGSSANTAIVLQKFGAQTTLLSCVGSDFLSEIALNSLSDCGINLSFVQKDCEKNTGLNFIVITPNGERTMFGYRGSNTNHSPLNIPSKAFLGADMLHLSGYAFIQSTQQDAAWEAVKLAKEFRVPISLDTALEPVIHQPQEIRKILPHLSVCILGLEEAHALVGSDSPELACKALQEFGIKTIAIKLGSSGSYLFYSQHGEFIPPFHVNSVDATGAGDAFSAGLLISLMYGLDFQSAGILSGLLGAIATTCHGGGANLPGQQDALVFLKQLPSHSGLNLTNICLKNFLEQLS